MKRVSRVGRGWVVLWLICLSGSLFSGSLTAQSGTPTKTQAPAAPATHDPQRLFEAGEIALRAGRLDEAEHDFRGVLEVNPRVAGAYTNLGVIEMRRKQWSRAIDLLKKAAALDPQMAGIRLNIGLVYYRQKNFSAAIEPFEEVVRQSPDSYQAKYLLGFCYFFTDRWADAVATLEPLWERVASNDQLNYLYVLGRAAEISKNTTLEEKAYARLAEIGQGSPEFHMILGKAHLNRGEYDDALRELEQAARADPKLPLVHYYLGMTYVREQDYQRARVEFREDLTAEPDSAISYQELGKVESALQSDAAAAQDFRRAVKFDPQLVEAHMGLAAIEERKKEYSAALAQLDEVIRLDESNASARYLRGQVLLRMGKGKEGLSELTIATKMMNEKRVKRHSELEGETVQSPELTREPN